MYPILGSERIILRPFTADDADDVFSLVKTYDGQNGTREFAHIRTVEDAQKLNDGTVRAGSEWMIVDKASQTPVGWVVCARTGGAELTEKVFIHAWLRDEYQRMGLGREILEAVLHFAFFGIGTGVVLANARNSERAAYRLLSGYGFEIYNHVPKGRPDDPDTLVQFRISRENYIALDGVIPGAYDFRPPVREQSPYSYENPVRTIDSIDCIKEPTGYLCGQSVVAMLAGVSVDEVIEVMRTDQGTGVLVIRDALKYFGFKTATKARVKYAPGESLPGCCILSVKLPGYGHWSLYYKGKYYDPEFGVLDRLPDNARIVSYWEIVI